MKTIDRWSYSPTWLRLSLIWIKNVSFKLERNYLMSFHLKVTKILNNIICKLTKTKYFILIFNINFNWYSSKNLKNNEMFSPTTHVTVHFFQLNESCFIISVIIIAINNHNWRVLIIFKKYIKSIFKCNVIILHQSHKVTWLVS